ncbi:hypothetical protein AB9M62_33495 [Bacillales bacterium AN1005]
MRYEKKHLLQWFGERVQDRRRGRDPLRIRNSERIKGEHRFTTCDYSNGTRIMIGYRPDNQIAGTLYESLGFMQVSREVIDGEIVRSLQIDQS